MSFDATPETEPGTARGFTYVSACAHCGRPVERVVGSARWSHVDSQRARCEDGR